MADGKYSIDPVVRIRWPPRGIWLLQATRGGGAAPPLSKLEDYYQPSVDRVVDEVIATMEF